MRQKQTNNPPEAFRQSHLAVCHGRLMDKERMDKKKKNTHTRPPGLGKYGRETCRLYGRRRTVTRVFMKTVRYVRRRPRKRRGRNDVSVNRRWNRRRDFNDSGGGGSGGIARTTPVVPKSVHRKPFETAACDRVPDLEHKMEKKTSGV